MRLSDVSTSPLFISTQLILLRLPKLVGDLESVAQQSLAAEVTPLTDRDAGQ